MSVTAIVIIREPHHDAAFFGFPFLIFFSFSFFVSDVLVFLCRNKTPAPGKAESSTY